MKKIILWSVIVIFTLVIAAAGFFWWSRPQVIQVDKNTKLTLLAVEYGRRHKAPVVKPKAAPQNNRRQFYGGGPAAFTTTNDTLVVWVLDEHPANQWPNFQALAYDKAETACVGNWGNSNMRQISPTETIIGIQLNAFPRHDRSFYLRFASWGNGGQRVSKDQFVISNPARGKTFPQWTPEPLPDTQSDGDLNVTLTKLVYGVQGFNGGVGSATDPMHKAVLAAFHMEQNGSTVTNWEPVRIETSDATGNDVQNNSWSNGRDDNGDATMTYQWGLWPDEPWKLHVEMSQTSGFSDDEIWTVTNVPVNPGDQQDMWGYGNRRIPVIAETTLGGIPLKLYSAIQFTNQNWGGDGEKPGGFRVQLGQGQNGGGQDPGLNGLQMTLVSATDEQGRTVQAWNNYSWGGGDRQVQFQNLRNATSLNITIALHRDRFFDFTVKPAKQ
ncbi:MAG TPA: hypothetical protein VMB22_07985 [Verrucomicrobiae bacterium]|nr:hypothetical protein [Verrucomicrobiae bacterium]